MKMSFLWDYLFIAFIIYGGTQAKPSKTQEKLNADHKVEVLVDKLQHILEKEIQEKAISGKGCLLTEKGAEYIGTWSQTKDGLTCQTWDAQTPHSHRNWFSSDMEQKAAKNYCRNPDNEPKPWCYTVTSTRWQVCDVPMCQTLSSPPVGYKGWKNVHISGLNLRTYQGLTVQQCAIKCDIFWATINPNTCASFDYDVNQQICYISDRTIDTILAESSLMFKDGIDHYEKDALAICNIPDKERQLMPGENLNHGLCLLHGGCYASGKCYLSKSQQRKNLPCDSTCQSVIQDVISNFNTANYNQKFLDASLVEAKTFFDNIPQTFWTWLMNQQKMKEAIFAAKWPIEPRLIENLYELVAGFSEAVAEANVDIFVGVAYSMISNGVKTRVNMDYLPNFQSTIPKGVAKAEGLTPEDTAKMNTQEDEAAKAALAITAQQEQVEFNKIQERLSTCSTNPANNWVLYYKAGDGQTLSCKQMKQKNVASITDCQKLACSLHSNGFNYNNGACDVQYCMSGNLQLSQSSSTDVWIFKKSQLGCSMDSNSTPGKQSQGEFSAVNSVSTIADCKKQCLDRYACKSATLDSTNNKCLLNMFINDISVPANEATTRFTTVKKTCTFQETVPETGCLLTTKGMEYSGTQTQTENGNTCQVWDLQTPHDHRNWFKDSATQTAAVNYCRNPDGEPRPWCYTTDINTRWELCNIPSCIKADEPDVFTKLHSVSENKMSNCYNSVEKTTQPDVQTCLSKAITRKVKVVQYDPNSKLCELRLCYTSDLAITDASSGYEIYVDNSLVFDEGQPKSTWDSRKHVSYLHEYIWSIFALSWAATCKVPSPTDLKFPPRDDRMNGFDLVQHFLSRRYEFWDFPTLTTPWPIVALIWPESSKRECDYVWSVLYQHVEPHFYSTYTFDYEKVQCIANNWYPDRTIPRIIVDGGVCGRQSYLEEQSRRCLGQPALGLRQPGHRALIYYSYNEGNPGQDVLAGPYRVSLGHSITGCSFYSNIWAGERTMFYPTGFALVNYYITIEYYKGIAASLNKGITSFTKGLTAVAVHRRAPASQKDATLDLVVQSILANPYMVNVWFYVMDIWSGSSPDWTNTEALAMHNRFATQCPTGSTYTSRKSELWNVAKQSLRRETNNLVGFPVVYTDIVLRLYAPAPCCTDSTTATTVLTELQQEIDNFASHITNQYDIAEMKRIIRQNMALCKAHAGSTWLEILNFMKPNLLEPTLYNNWRWRAGRISTAVTFINTNLMSVKAGDMTTNQKAIVDYLIQQVVNSMPQIEVNQTTWFLSPKFEILSKYIQDLYTATGDTASLSSWNTHLADLVDRAHGTDLVWWRNMADSGLVEGSYADIMNGVKVWNAAKNVFEITSKRQMVDEKELSREEENAYLLEELKAIERELKMYL